MKLDPVFTVKENKLYKIDSQALVDLSTLKQIEIPWSTVEIEPETYNEEYLANLRETLKSMENSNTFAILVPVADKKLETPEDFELFTNAFNHTARRVKDATSVAGFLLPKQMTEKGFSEGTPADDFIQTIAKKHQQYVTFAKKSDGENFVNTETTIVIL